MKFKQLEFNLGPIGYRRAGQQLLGLGPISVVPVSKKAALARAREETTPLARTRVESLNVECSANIKCAPSRSREDEILSQVETVIGDENFSGGFWRTVIRRDQKAVLFAIEDFKIRTAAQRAKIRDRGAWLCDRFKRAKREIDEVWSKIA